MSELVLPTTLNALANLIQGDSPPPPAEVAQNLRVLQRLGLSRTELTVHIERLRAVNDVSSDNDQTEDNALLALEMIAGSTRLGLDWSAAEVAAAWLPRALTPELFRLGADVALAPSDLLPPRPRVDGEGDLATRMAARQWIELSEQRFVPTTADFFRAPKAGLTTRPAALLAPQDRFVYEALAEVIAPAMANICPPHVVWPRDRSLRGKYSQFTEAPRSWEVNFVARTDVASYYESIDHAFLAVVVGRVLGVGGNFTLALEAFLDAVMGSTIGLPQGPAASDLFASAYLADIDLELQYRGWPVTRYADDILIGAASFAEARQRLRETESLLRERGLQLSNEKTRVVRLKTYVRNLDEPAEKISFRRTVQLNVEEWLYNHPEADDDEVLRGVGIPEESLWDLFYHGTIALAEALAQVEDRLLPPWIDAYQRVFAVEAQRLRAGGYADDNGALAVAELRECLMIMTAGSKPTDLDDVDAVINWHPTLVRHVSDYLTSLANDESEHVAKFLDRRIESALDSDLELAWLLNTTIARPSVAEAMTDSLRVASQASWRPLSRATATKALAGVGQLSGSRWADILSQSSAALRGELLLAREANPEMYPDLPAPFDIVDKRPK